MPRNKESDQAPPGYLTPQQAAELLGYSDQTIRNQIKSGRLPGREVVHENGEVRYYAAREAVDMLLNYNMRNGLGGVETSLVVDEIANRHASDLVRILEEAAAERGILLANQEKMIQATAEIAEHLGETAKIQAEDLEQQREFERRRTEQSREWRKIAYVFLAILLVLFIMSVLRNFTPLLPLHHAGLILL